MKQEDIPKILTEVLSSNRMIQWEIDCHRVVAHDSKGDTIFSLDPVNIVVEVQGTSMKIMDDSLYRLVYWKAAQALDPDDFHSLSRDLLRSYSHKGDHGQYVSIQAMDQAALHVLLEKCL